MTAVARSRMRAATGSLAAAMRQAFDDREVDFRG
jgi:hypothetical protein